jgi:Protein of unknown function (DUF3662)/FHA domain
MGGLQRFERRLSDMVEGAFARAFKNGVQPVEIGSALTREIDDRKVIGPTNTLAPNLFTVELSARDYERLEPYLTPLSTELGTMVAEHASESGYSFSGPPQVQLKRDDSIDMGVFRIRSSVGADTGERAPAPPPRPRGSARERLREVSNSAPPDAWLPEGPPLAPPGRPATRLGAAPGDADLRGRTSRSEGNPRLVLAAGASTRSGTSDREQVLPLDSAVTLIGRGSDTDLQLTDSGVSRRHAEIRRDTREGHDVLTDLGSTNGTLLNGRRVAQARLEDGDRITVGSTSLVYRKDGEHPRDAAGSSREGGTNGRYEA